MKSHSFKKNVALSLFLAITFLFLSALTPNSITMVYGDIMGCEEGCNSAARGYLFPFIVDYPGLSPQGSVGITGALLGDDIVIWKNLWFSLLLFVALGALTSLALCKFIKLVRVNRNS